MPLLLLIFVLAAGGGEAADIATNGDFGAGTTGWHLVGRGSLSHSTDGAGQAGSLEMTGGLAGSATVTVAGQCISPVSSSQGLEFQAVVKVVSGTPEYCRVAVFESESDDCSWIALGAEVRRSTFSGGWDGLLGGGLTTSGATGSVELRLHCANTDGDTDPLQVRFDDVVVNTVSIVSSIFSDGFESGDTSVWSSATP